MSRLTKILLITIAISTCACGDKNLNITRESDLLADGSFAYDQVEFEEVFDREAASVDETDSTIQ